MTSTEVLYILDPAASSFTSSEIRQVDPVSWLKYAHPELYVNPNQFGKSKREVAIYRTMMRVECISRPWKDMLHRKEDANQRSPVYTIQPASAAIGSAEDDIERQYPAEFYATKLS